MTTHSQLSTTKPKKKQPTTNKLSKQNRNSITEMEITWRVISGKVQGDRMGEKVQGISGINGR